MAQIGPPDEVIDAGDFMFLSKYAYNTGSFTWNSSVVHNNTVLNDDETGYKLPQALIRQRI